jgi:hypothetical protein
MRANGLTLLRVAGTNRALFWQAVSFKRHRARSCASINEAQTLL